MVQFSRGIEKTNKKGVKQLHDGDTRSTGDLAVSSPQHDDSHFQ